MASNIFEYLGSLGYPVAGFERPDDKVAMKVLDENSMNSAQKKRMAERYMVMEKLDGVFAFVTYINVQLPESGEKFVEVRHWTRTGYPMRGCEELDKRVLTTLGTDYPSHIFISEVTSELPLAELSAYLNRNRTKKQSEAPKHLCDNFHDRLGVWAFITGITHEPANRRHRYLEMTGLPTIPFYYAPLDIAEDHVQELWHEGKEGFVLRDPDSPWEAGKRIETQIKLKERMTYDCQVVGMCSGKEGTKYEYMLGKLLVAFRLNGVPSGDLVVIPVSGMKDIQRQAWWTNPELIIGKCVEIEAKSFTAKGNLREARFKRIRTDKEADFSMDLNESPRTFGKSKCYWRVWYD